jgi:hypothetical protein
MKTLRFFEKAGTASQVTKRYFPEATILRNNTLEQSVLNINAKEKTMSLRPVPYCKLQGTK